MEYAILYGSQTGNCEQIANEFTSMLEEQEPNINVTCKTLNEFISTFGGDAKQQTIFIICSTTGNGDPPENASLFWRKIKNRNMPKTYFQNTQYFVVGLGDTNYNQYCRMGKTIYQRMKELGSISLGDIILIDEVYDIEEQVEAMYKTVLPLFPSYSQQY